VAKVVALRKRRRLVKMAFMRPRLQRTKRQRKSSHGGTLELEFTS